MEQVEYLQNLDREVTLAINGFHSEFWDSVMLLLSGKLTFIWLYALIAVYIFGRSQYRMAGVRLKNNITLSAIIILSCLLVFTLTDLIGHEVIKPFFKRLRPGHDPIIGELVRTPDGKGGKYGFVSNHAANFIGFATISALFIKRYWYTITIFFVALAVGYSRIYLARHFLGDIIGGIVFGMLCGGIIYLLAKYIILNLYRKGKITSYNF